MACHEKSNSIWARYNKLLTKYVFAKLIELTVYETMKDGKLGAEEGVLQSILLFPSSCSFTK